MFILCQKLILESFHRYLLEVFLTLANFFEANEHFFSRNLNHHCKCREQKENF